MKNVYFYVIFYDHLNDPIDVEIERYSPTIPARLAKRTFISVEAEVSNMVRNPPELTTEDMIRIYGDRYVQNLIKTYGYKHPDVEKYIKHIKHIRGRVEFRILDFEIVE